MKRTLATCGLLGAAAVALGLYGTRTVQADPPAPAAAASRTRIAVVNFHEVIKNSRKLDSIRAESKRLFEQYDGQLKGKQEEFNSLQKDMQPKDKDGKPISIPKEQRDVIEGKMNKLRYEIDEITKKGQKEIMSFEQKALAEVYKEVNKHVSDYAKQNGIDLVFRFNEDWGDGYHEPAAVVDRLKHPMWPMYWDPSLNITGTIRQKFDTMPAPAPKQ